MIAIRNYHKKFNAGTINEVYALRGVDLEVNPGDFITIIGTNGSGKSTLLNAVAGVFLPDKGSITIAGNDVTGKKDFERAKYISRVFQNPFMGTATEMTIAENLHMASLRGKKRLPVIGLSTECRNVYRGEVKQLEMQLEDRLDNVIGTLSGGQRQRLLLALALVNDPKIVFLDEPTTGLDPQSRRNFWELIRRIQAQGKTILLTTHYMEEARVLCDEIAIMDRGRIIAQGEPGELLKHSFETVFIRLPVSEDALPADFAWPRRARGNGVEIETTDVNDAMRLLVEAGVDLGHMQVESPTLEDLFLELTGKDLRA